MKKLLNRNYLILTLIGALVIVVPIFYLFSAPTNKSACCSIGTSYGDSIVNPAKGGDKDMFTVPSLPPNIIWLLDTSGSMRDIACGGNCDSTYSSATGFYRCNLATSPNYGKVYPSQNNCGTNCGGNSNCVKTSPCGIDKNNYLDAFTKFGYSWQQATLDPFDSEATRPYNSFEDQRNSQTPADGLFEAYRVYYGPSGGSCGFTWTNGGFDITVCQGTVSTSQYECNTTGTLYNNQNTCLSACTNGSCFSKPTGNSATSCTTSACRNCVKQLREKGYWYSGSRYYFSGNLLNYYPPKYVIGRKVLKDVIVDTRKIRMGLFRFDGVRPPNSCNSCSDGGCGACIIGDLNPPCPLCLNEGAAYDNNRNSLINAINNMSISQFNTNTPTAEALFNIGQYYSGEYSTVFGAGSVKSGLNPKSGANDSIAYSCMQNYAVVITDGLPTQDGNNYNVATAVGNSDGDNNTCDRAGSFDPAVCPPNSTPGSGYGHLLDDVAYSIYTKDLRPSMTGTQKVVTYTIGFGTEMFGGDDLLRRAATNSTGLYFSAENKDALADSLKQVLEDVIRRATSYANISAASFQASATSGALIPRFFPSTASFWKGYLYNFNLYSEALAGIDLSNDGDYLDEFVTDYDGDIVTVDNATGYPVKAKDNTTAVPYWEAGECLSESGYSPPTGFSCYLSSDSRRIYTAVDLNNNGVIESNEQIPFAISQLLNIKDYLGLEGNSFCSDFQTQLGFTFPDATKVTSCAGFTNATDYCACLIIEFVRGKDILDENGNGSRNDDRPWKLGDIFHSTPREVNPPFEEGRCKKELSGGQCIKALFAEQMTGTPIEIYDDGKNAYKKYLEFFEQRDKIVVVGANDGMLHAFHSGNAIPGDDPGTPEYIETFYWDHGSGKEAWAFIPPDLMPKLKDLTIPSGIHNYFVDSTPWIRDIWVDDNWDNKKQCASADTCEYRTIVVSGERGGGNHFFALDVTRATDPDDPNAIPQFLWMFPQPCSADSLKMGETYAENLPQPPPIGAIKYVDANPNGFRERYIALLNGGYDPLDLKGRGIFMVDAWTGEKIWDFTYNSTDPVKSNLKYSIPAVVGADDRGHMNNVVFEWDYLWDTAFVGDTGGQGWILRFLDPNPANWFGARLFEQSNHLPFFHIVQSAQHLDYGVMRFAVGTGDRENINDCNIGDCKYDNFRACALKGCSNISVSMTQEINGTKVTESKLWNASIKPTTDNLTFSPTGNNACSYVQYSVNPLEIASCPGITDDATPEKNASILCTSPWACTESREYDTVNIDATGSTTIQYYLYAPTTTKPLRTMLDDPANASAIDNSRFTDANMLDPDTQSVSAESDGFKVTYINAGINERTASGVNNVQEGCIIWPTYAPNCSGGTSDPCYTPGIGTGYLYQANIGTGRKDCVKSFEGLRSQTIGSNMPAPPVVAAVLTSTSILFYSIAGNWETSPPRVGEFSRQPGVIYWMEVPKPLHDCKHDGVCY